jgi:hypothetical protein
MNNILFLTYIILIILMVFYGGVNDSAHIEYKVSNLKKKNNIYKFYDILFNKEYIKNMTNPITDITKYCNSLNYIQNIIVAYNVNLYPSQYIDLKFKSNYLMIIAKNINEPLQLLVYNAFNKKYFYTINKKISITGIYPIYNNSINKINVIITIIKKPFWFHKI